MSDKIYAKLYTKPNCPHCRQTKEYFEKHGIKYVTESAEREETYEYLVSMGVKAMPFVEVRSDHDGSLLKSWSGLNRGNLEWLNELNSQNS